MEMAAPLKHLQFQGQLFIMLVAAGLAVVVERRG
jgi:hypothetical protein